MLDLDELALAVGLVPFADFIDGPHASGRYTQLVESLQQGFRRPVRERRFDRGDGREAHHRIAFPVTGNLPGFDLDRTLTDRHESRITPRPSGLRARFGLRIGRPVRNRCVKVRSIALPRGSNSAR